MTAARAARSPPRARRLSGVLRLDDDGRMLREATIDAWPSWRGAAVIL
jgi:hypothetical protein